MIFSDQRLCLIIVTFLVQIEEDGEERMIHLAPAELRKVLCEQLTSLIRPAGTVAVSKILLEYAKHFGFCLRLEDFKVDSVKALLLKLKNHIKVFKLSVICEECVSVNLFITKTRVMCGCLFPLIQAIVSRLVTFYTLSEHTEEIWPHRWLLVLYI